MFNFIYYNMLYLSYITSILEVIIITVPALLIVAYVTVAERKTMASMQRRLGPNLIGYYGLLQAFADALKLLLKEYVSPTQANFILFFLGPIITLVFSLLGYGVIPYAPGLSISDFNLGILYLLAVSSLATYGILLAGWSANSKYAFLGSLRSTAQLISYELILSSAILLVIFLTGSLNLSVIIEAQKAVWFIFPLFPVFLIFFIGSVAETNRAPFDLAEAESELVSGFMTEHAAVIFVFFFLAEYASIVLICILTSILFLGGYLLNIMPFLYLWYIMDISTVYLVNDLIPAFYSFFTLSEPVGNSLFNPFTQENLAFFITEKESWIFDPLFEGVFSGVILGVKSCVMIFTFIWARASFPRIRFDQLMSFCWTILLPLVIAFIILVPCILYSFEILPSNTIFF
jgi:NADH-ubiquinone oxidoreductase chain 1